MAKIVRREKYLKKPESLTKTIYSGNLALSSAVDTSQVRGAVVSLPIFSAAAPLLQVLGPSGRVVLELYQPQTLAG